MCAGVHNSCTRAGKEVEENEVPQILLQARPAFQHPAYWAVREDLNAAQKSRGFFGPRRGASGRAQGPRMKRSSIQQLKLRTRCARCRKLGHWARERPEGNRGQRNDERYDRRAVKHGENSKGFVTVAKPTERRPFFLGAFWTLVTLDPGEVLWDTGGPRGTRRETTTRQMVRIAHGTWSPRRKEPGETRIRKRHWRRDATDRCCKYASWFGWVQRHHPIHCRGAGRPTSFASGDNEDIPSQSELDRRR